MSWEKKGLIQDAWSFFIFVECVIECFVALVSRKIIFSQTLVLTSFPVRLFVGLYVLFFKLSSIFHVIKLWFRWHWW